MESVAVTGRQWKAQRQQLGAAVKLHENHALPILLTIRPHQFDVTQTKLKGWQQQPIDYVGALGLGTAFPIN